MRHLIRPNPLTNLLSRNPLYFRRAKPPFAISGGAFCLTALRTFVACFHVLRSARERGFLGYNPYHLTFTTRETFVPYPVLSYSPFGCGRYTACSARSLNVFSSHQLVQCGEERRPFSGKDQNLISSLSHRSPSLLRPTVKVFNGLLSVRPRYHG